MLKKMSAYNRFTDFLVIMHVRVVTLSKLYLTVTAITVTATMIQNLNLTGQF